ncbi:MAG: hypothetical protein KME04_13830 [Pleurocapsa minor GSE-CHR-MK-17-07R]|jgi:hypothetical protein|nr:hypothetical protein [Pleurocapsa minor GSE-CHR-MK 17-07R]
MKALIAILAVSFLSVSTPLVAQDNLETVRIAGSLVTEVPRDWDVVSNDGLGYFFETDNSTIRIRKYDILDQQRFEIYEQDSAGIFEWFVTDVYDTREYDPELIVETEIDGQQLLSYTFNQLISAGEYQRTIFVKRLASEFLAVGHIVSKEEGNLEEADVDDLRQAIINIQQDGQFVFLDGTSFSIGDDWGIISDINDAFAEFSVFKGSLNLRVSLWPGYGGITGLDNPVDFLAFIYDGNYRDVEPLNRAEYQDIQIAGFDAAFDPVQPGTLDSSGRYYRGFVSVITPNNGAYFGVITSEEIDSDIDPVYEVLDTMQPGRIFVCPLFAEAGIRLREEPSTNAALVRTIEDSETLIATEVVTDSAGFDWFFVGEGYVRSDVIFHEVSACSAIPGQ